MLSTAPVESPYGSSPRVRGTHSKRCAAADSDRFIPARAGNSASSVAEGSFVSVHPRACGELHSTTAGGTYADGSSPRVRGTHQEPRVGQLNERFIPARAGNSVRVCTLAGTATGSSPRVRGTRDIDGWDFKSIRFIPARAGNSRLQDSGQRLFSVHPRACGELVAEAWTPHIRAGSSPRVRGTRGFAPSSEREFRFIPARAGNSWDLTAPAKLAPVHPRACGELPSMTWMLRRLAGSSPRVRGTRRTEWPVQRIGRFIPARAGNSAPKKLS